ERDLAGVVRDEEAAPLRQVPDPVRLDPEPVTIEKGADGERVLRGLGVEAPGVVAVRVQPRRNARHPVVDLLLEAGRVRQRGRRDPREERDGVRHARAYRRTLAKTSSSEKRGVNPVACWKRRPSSVHGYLRKFIAPGGVW